MVYPRPTAAITGRAHIIELLRVSAVSGGSGVTPDKHDSSSPNLPAQVTCLNLPTSHTAVATIIGAPTYTEESGNQMGFKPLYRNWGNGVEKPLTLREGEGALLLGGPYAGTGVIGLKLTFTVE
jgi:hypothetical protein